MAKNLCVFCKSPAFGPGCPFSPTKIHFHASDPKRCCWCGSVAVGLGCPFNPHGKFHVHGIEFNAMVKETIEKSIILGYLMSELSVPITEMTAYKLGLIDKDGKKSKTPTTATELSAYGPLEEYIIGLKQTFGNKLELLHNAITVNLESHVNMDDYAKLYESTLNLQENFKQIGNDFNKVVTTAYAAGLSKAAIEKLIITSILEK